MSFWSSLAESLGINSGMFNFFSQSTNDLGIDLGTVNTLICTSNKGVVLREPSVVAIDHSVAPPEVIEVGLTARDMIGRTPTHIQATRPMRDGVIAEFEWAEAMLRKFIEKVSGEKGVLKARPGRIVVGLRSGVTEVERRAVGDAAYSSGARIVNLVPEPMAAAIGAGMPVEKPTGSMIIDIGGGTTEIAVLSLNGIVVSKSLRIAGDELNENIQEHLKKIHNLSVGERTAEEIKIRLGSAFPQEEDEEMDVRGLNLSNGLPHTITINTGEIRECLKETLNEMIIGIKETLEQTPPELASDIIDRGIMLAGGGALLHGMDELINREVGVPVHIANDPLSCVVLGTEKLITDDTYNAILAATEYDPRQYN